MKIIALAIAILTALSSMGLAYYRPGETERQTREIAALTRNPELQGVLAGAFDIHSISRGATDETGTRYYVRAGKCTAFMRALPLSVTLDPLRTETRLDAVDCE